MTIELALSLTVARRLGELEALSALDAPALAGFLDDDGLAGLPPAGAVASHLYFGSEFCEHLFPDRQAVQRAIAVAERHGLTLVLATPIASDSLVARVLDTVALLPPAAEILVNDWGVASAIRAAQPGRHLVAGRQLAKMIKDPRLPSPAWMKVHQSSYGAEAYRRILARLGMQRIELDVPPFATPDMYDVPDLAISVWAPFSYVAKGRICKVGSLQAQREEKFAPGLVCRTECLGVLEAGTEPSVNGIVSYGRGNAIFYRHTPAMTQVLRSALEQGRVSRLVLSGV